jgi:hypothetical protein
MKDPSTGMQVAILLERYDNEMEMTFGDLVEGIEELAMESGDADLSIAVGRYREEERYDRFYLGMRGDMDTVENEFIESIRLKSV